MERVKNPTLPNIADNTVAVEILDSHPTGAVWAVHGHSKQRTLRLWVQGVTECFPATFPPGGLARRPPRAYLVRDGSV